MKKVMTRLAVLMLIPTAALAADAGVHFLTKDSRLLCESDRLALCVNVDRKDAEACLVGHYDDLTDADCKAAVKTAKGQVSDFMQTCQIDIDLRCTGMDYGSDLLACLKKHRKELLGSCREQL